MCTISAAFSQTLQIHFKSHHYCCSNEGVGTGWDSIPRKITIKLCLLWVLCVSQKSWSGCEDSRVIPEMESRDSDGGCGAHARDGERERTVPCVPPPEWWRAAGASLWFVPRIRRCHISLTGQQASLLLHPSLTSMRIITQCQCRPRTTRRVARRCCCLKTHSREKPQSAVLVSNLLLSDSQL